MSDVNNSNILQCCDRTGCLIQVLLFVEGYIVGTPPPPSFENWVTGEGGAKFFAGKGGWCRNGGRRGRGGHFFITLQFHHIYCVWGESKVPFITFCSSALSWPYKILIQLFIVLKPNIICTFRIHYGSVQKMLTVLFNFVWNTQKNKWSA